MDYVVGSVAALISGDANVTPNRPKLTKRALTPTKHQLSPNVTPKSELVGDRSIFLSPSVQRKKAIVKKSPKRIFENPDFEVTNDGEGTCITSPKAEKVKKHLKDDLEASPIASASLKSPKSPKGKLNRSLKPESPKKKLQVDCEEETFEVNVQVSNENTPKKKKKQHTSILEASGTFKIEEKENVQSEDLISVVNGDNDRKSPKKNNKSVSVSTGNIQVEEIVKETAFTADKSSKKKLKKSKSPSSPDLSQKESPQKQNQTGEEASKDTKTNPLKSKKAKKRKKKSKLQNVLKNDTEQTSVNQESIKSPKNKENTFNVNAITNKDSDSEPEPDEIESPKQKKKKSIVNPNAITNEDSDSEHESDDEIESETEQVNNEILDTGPFHESSDEEDDKKPEKKEHTERNSEEEIKRTLFVGNVPFSSKTKKEIKKIFSKYGEIETVRVRTVPVKDARYTPKLAVIKNELHPDRTTVNVYVKFIEASSVEMALVENNTVLNAHHLRVSRSDSSGAEHDPRCAVFVGNLPFSIEDEAFRTLFEKCGEIDSVRIVRDKKTNAGKGFGYVNFASKDGVELALAMTEEDLMVKNKILRVQRCTQNPRKQSKITNSNDQGRNQGGFRGRNQDENHGFQGRNQGDVRGRGRGGSQGSNRGGFQGRNQGFQGRNQGDVRGRGRGGFQGSNREGFQGRNQGFQGRNQGDVRGRGRGGFRGSNREGFQGRDRGGFQGRNQDGFQGRNQDSFQGKGGFGRQDGEQKVDGAQRRLMNKRKSDEGDGPPNKRANNNEPAREKKERKEFVGMTAEKKKKHKVNKGQKKKKALSEILSK